MLIQILGTGCPKCNKLAANAQAAVESTGADAQVQKVTDINDIARFGVLFTPALVLDGKVKVAGKVVSPETIAEWIQAAGG